jgi:hypothetical protein
MILLKIDTSLLDQFSSIITLVVAGGMILIVGRFLFSKNIAGAIFSILICGLLLWSVNSLNSFMALINNIVAFIGGIFGV